MDVLFQAKRILNGIRRRVLGERHVTLFYQLAGMFPQGSVLFVPEAPHHPGYVINKVCADLRLRPVRSGPATVAMLWQDKTHVDAIPSDLKLINGRCTDISKRRMEEAFAKVFDYPLAIDPLTYTGKAVCKSDENAAHDGRVIECPVSERDPTAVYEVLIDNSIGPDVVEDIRIVVVGEQLPLAYLKRRWKYQRFLNTNFEVKTSDVKSVTSEDERRLILKFAREIGLDFGELDALRDATTGRLYIVDAAKTAFGPPARLSFVYKFRSVRRLSRAFKSEFLTAPHH